MNRLHKMTSFLLDPLRYIMLASRLLFSTILLIISFNISLSSNFNYDGFKQLFLIDKTYFSALYVTFYFFILLNLYEYVIQLLCGFYRYPAYINPIFIYFIVISKLLLTLFLSFWSIQVFLASLDIWYNISLDLSFQWDIMNVYYYSFVLYLLINIVEVFYNWDILGKWEEKRERKRIEKEDKIWSSI